MKKIIIVCGLCIGSVFGEMCLLSVDNIKNDQQTSITIVKTLCLNGYMYYINESKILTQAFRRDISSRSIPIECSCNQH